MKWSSQFSSENLLMSVGGHLILVAIMVTSFAVVINRAKLVTPDRIQIMEINLNDVKISGDETQLYNVGVPEPEVAVAPEPEKKAEPIPEPEITEEKPIETPTMVEDSVPEKATEKSADNPVKDENSAQKKRRVIRVNREVRNLDRTLTVSVVDALRVAMTRCWNIDTKRTDIDDIRAVAHLTLRRNGTVRDVWFESAARAESDPAFAYVLDTIRAAINTCQPFKMLPPNEFDKWEKVELTFYPTQGKVL